MTQSSLPLPSQPPFSFSSLNSLTLSYPVFSHHSLCTTPNQVHLESSLYGLQLQPMIFPAIPTPQVCRPLSHSQVCLPLRQSRATSTAPASYLCRSRPHPHHTWRRGELRLASQGPATNTTITTTKQPSHSHTVMKYTGKYVCTVLAREDTTANHHI